MQAFTFIHSTKFNILLFCSLLIFLYFILSLLLGFYFADKVINLIRVCWGARGVNGFAIIVFLII